MEKIEALVKANSHIDELENKLIQNEKECSEELASLVCDEVKLVNNAVTQNVAQVESFEKNLEQFKKEALTNVSNNADKKLNEALLKWRIF